MNLYVVRHALARRAEPGEDDAQRPLTEKGRDRFRKEVRAMGALKLKLDRLYHSPWLRAVQTADLLSDRLDGESVVTPHLARSPTEALLEQLEGEAERAARGSPAADRREAPERATDTAVAVVGHQPWLGELCAWLVHGDRGLAAQCKLGKGGVVWLEGDPRPSGMTLRALLPPRWLRRLA